MNRGSFQRRLRQLARQRCATRPHWKRIYREVHWSWMFVRAIVFLAITLCGPLAIFVTVMTAEVVLGIDPNQPLAFDKIAPSRLMAAVGSLPLWFLLCLFVSTNFVRLSLIQPLETSTSASLPRDDARVLSSRIRRVALCGSAWLAIFSALVYGVAAWSLDFSWIGWLFIAMLILAQLSCVYALAIILGISFARWLRVPVLGILVVLAGLLLCLSIGKDGQFVGLPRPVQTVLGFVPTSWPTRAFEAVFIDGNALGLGWLLPIPLFVYFAERAVKRNVRVVDFISPRAGLELAQFVPGSTLENLPQPKYLRTEDSQIGKEIERAASVPGKVRAAASIRRELDSIGSIDDLRWPLSRFMRFGTNRRNELADLAQAWLRTWRIPWIGILSVFVGALGLFYFVPYYPADRRTTMPVFIMSVCLGLVVMRRAAAGLDQSYRGFFQLPVAFGEWFMARTMLSAAVVSALLIPLSVLLATVYLYVQPLHEPLALLQGAAAALLIAAIPLVRTVASFLMVRTNFIDERPFRPVLFAILCLFLLEPICEIFKNLSPGFLAPLLVTAVTCAFGLGYVACRWLYLRDRVDIKDAP